MYFTRRVLRATVSDSVVESVQQRRDYGARGESVTTNDNNEYRWTGCDYAGRFDVECVEECEK